MSQDKRDPARKPASASFPARLGTRSASSALDPRNRGPLADAAVLRPQRPLREAAQDRLRPTQPQGLGLDSPRVRDVMVQRLCKAGLTDARVMQAMSRVPRHLFVDSALANQSYEDTSLPIGLGQTISKPSVVARMLELLAQRPGVGVDEPRPLGRVLEVGTGCGYQAAVLAELAREVISIERLRPLHERARDNLRSQKLLRVTLLWADGMVGHAPRAPYDTIVAAAGGSELPPAWLEQLAPGGRLVAPVARDAGADQALCVVDRLQSGELRHALHEAVLFVPLKSGVT